MRRNLNQRLPEREESPPEEEGNAAGGNLNRPAAEYPDRNETQRRRSEEASNTGPQHSGCFTVIPPNQSRRSDLQAAAQREEAALERWREENRVQSVHIAPQRLGGGASEAEARRNQVTEFHSSKIQKRLKKMEMDKRRRQEEEEKNQRMKDTQRQKAELREQREQQEQQMRREQLQEDHFRTTETFFQQLEIRAADRLPSSCATHTSSRSDAEDGNRSVKEKKSEKEVQEDHRRVNSAFLDRLEAAGRQEVERPPPPAAEAHSLAQLRPRPQPEPSESTGAADPEPEQTLMRLQSSFPDSSPDFLLDILEQCGWDYHRAFALLIT
ncbi:epithelial-stromal interaction protein 1 [Salarias fasciatus]|uniref:epithelial-stromal interaction protein 1 n=1 Tax=Salarias fasciatus TaxID=181472 RepID=UPI00117677F6|nr:epithelial-stromal interaction protein 1 [Salarias fasciatus]